MENKDTCYKGGLYKRTLKTFWGNIHVNIHSYKNIGGNELLCS